MTEGNSKIGNSTARKIEILNLFEASRRQESCRQKGKFNLLSVGKCQNCTVLRIRVVVAPMSVDFLRHFHDHSIDWCTTPIMSTGTA